MQGFTIFTGILHLSRPYFHPTMTAPSTYADCPFVVRAVRIGASATRLLAEFQQCGIELNEAGHELFAHDRFTGYETPSILDTVEITVNNLGFAEGATMPRSPTEQSNLVCLFALSTGRISDFSILTSPKVASGIPQRSIERRRVH